MSDTSTNLKQTQHCKATQELKISDVNISSIAAYIGRSRTTIHTNKVLMDYIDLSIDELERENPYSIIDKLTEERKQLKEQISLMEIRDVKAELLKHEKDTLQRQLDEEKKENKKLRDRNRKLSAELHKLKVGEHKTTGKTRKIVFPDFNASKAKPEDYSLGGNFGSINDFSEAIRQAGKMDTETIMLYIDNANFIIPPTDLLGDYKMVLHAPLNINLASENIGIRNAAVEMMVQIILKCNRFSNNISAMIIHPGNADTDDFLIESLNKILPLADFDIAIETMSGKGKELGANFKDLKKIQLSVGNPHNLKFCIDTCHIFDAGYDLSSSDIVINDIISTLGVDNIAALHINDSQNICGSKKDRHANIGEGKIPLKSLQKIVQSEVFDGIPKILETPLKDGFYNYEHEMQLLISRIKE